MAKEQQLLKDRLFHSCQKGITDSVKYRHADTTVDYMSFLEKCREAEDEDGVGKTEAKGKIKIAAATARSPTYSDAFAKQLKKQQQQFHALIGKEQATVTTLQSKNAQATSSFCQENPSLGIRGRGGCPFMVMVGPNRGPTPNKTLHNPSRNRRMLKPTLIISVGNVVRWDISKGAVPC